MSSEFKQQPDGRMVAGPDLSNLDQDRSLVKVAVVSLTAAAVLTAGFLGGRATAPTPEPSVKPAVAEYADQSLALHPECNAVMVVVTPIDKPLSDEDVAQFEQNLLLSGYTAPRVNSVDYGGKPYALIGACYEIPDE